MSIEREVKNDYARPGLEEAILDALRKTGKDPERLSTADLAAIDEFHLGWHQATIEFARSLGLAPGMTVLDIGAGLGGPARYFASAHGCSVTGLDLTPDFVAAAEALTRRTGLTDRVSFVEGSALDMPFPDASFDAASLIHVGMNIEDKARLFAEARRVLRPGGRFGVYDIMRTGDGELPMPMPWASTAATSFLETPDGNRALLEAAGFRPGRARSRGAEVVELFTAMRARQAQHGTRHLGLHLVIGPDAGERIRRLVACVEKGMIAPVEIICETD
jgi:SAM-dependent methyltransferase